MNEELMQEIKALAPWLLVAVLAVGGYYGIRDYRAKSRAAASEAFVAAYTVEELEQAVADYGKAASGGAIKLRLAKKYFDSARYEESLALYDELAAAPVESFEDYPAVGRAQCLEALGKYDEALKAFADFIAANPASCLALTAKLGEARVLAQLGRGEEAEAKLKALSEELKDDPLSTYRIDATLDCVKRAGK